MGIAIGALFSTGCHLAVRGYDVLVSAWVVQQSQPVAAIHLKKEGRAGVRCSLVLFNGYVGHSHWSFTCDLPITITIKRP